MSRHSELLGRLDGLTFHKFARQSGRLRVIDTAGHVLPSLFVNIPVDPRYSEFRQQKPRTCGPPRRSGSAWESARRYLSLLRFPNTVVRAQVSGCSLWLPDNQ